MRWVFRTGLVGDKACVEVIPIPGFVMSDLTSVLRLA